jgi:hypothetical protein
MMSWWQWPFFLIGVGVCLYWAANLIMEFIWWLETAPRQVK